MIKSLIVRKFSSNQFKSITNADKAHFLNLLGPAGVVSELDSETLKTYNSDWMNRYSGNSHTVLRPKDKFQVSGILSYCNQHSIAVVPQGGNTGLVGGSVPVRDEIIISTQRMNQIRSFDEVSGILECDSGCILEVLDDWLLERGFMMPLDLGAKGSCHIGGNIATNAGGLRLLRYGSLHGTVLSLEVVLPDGRILNFGKPLRKDNTGYDLKHLFIGSEGTLGFITGLSILTPPKPKAKNVALLGLNSFKKVQEAFKLSKQNLGEILSAFEFFDKHSMDLVTTHTPSKNPFSDTHEFYILIETSGSSIEHDAEKIGGFLESLIDSEIVSDGLLASSNDQIKTFWEIRGKFSENINY